MSTKSRRCATFKFACLKIGAQRLCLALILGLLVVPAFVAAPLLFHVLDDRMLAGEIAGRMFHICNTGVLLLGFAVAAFWLRRGVARSAWLLLALLLLTVALNEFAVAGVLAEIKAAAGQLTALPATHPLRQRFGFWHGVSVGLHLVSAVAAAILVALQPGGVSCSR